MTRNADTAPLPDEVERHNQMAGLIVELLAILKFGGKGYADDIHIRRARDIVDGFPDEVRDQGELNYRAYCLADPDHEPEGTLESLAMVATMLETYGPDALPANDQGQVHFARAMIDSAAREIRAAITAMDNRTSAVTDEMVDAGVKVAEELWAVQTRTYVRQIYLAMSSISPALQGVRHD